MLLFSVFKHCAKCICGTFYVKNIQLCEHVQTLGLHVVKSVAQRELAEGSQVENRSFLLLFSGELLGDAFLLIQHGLKEHSREVIAITDESLRRLFLFKTLAKDSFRCNSDIDALLPRQHSQ
ncbi:protein SWEETIE isoform X6 [Elaeis guineensis]|uniref:protein SWEETIE isoform X6 n=1 Tax=Elaeis guineensis var. tenera TaxID=51953 RepID=UPI003C6D2615